MPDTTFKTAEPTPEPQAPAEQPGEFKPPESVVVPSTPVPKDTNIPLEQYYKENDNNPYASNFFDMNDTPFSYLPAKVQQQMKDIDKFVDQEIADRGWKHNTHSYEQVLSDTLLELGDIDGPVIDQIERLHGYATSILKLEGLDDVRKNLKSRIRKMQTKRDMDNLILKEIGKKIL